MPVFILSLFLVLFPAPILCYDGSLVVVGYPIDIILVIAKAFKSRKQGRGFRRRSVFRLQE
jgi:hypothetical protein